MIPNHSVLRRNPPVIGSGSGDGALYCVTDDVTCCGTPPRLLSSGSGGSGNDRGHWYFPHDATIPSSTGHNGRWYASWLTGAVLLNYRGDGSNGATGLFRCEIQDSTGTTHHLYTCIYANAYTTDCELLFTNTYTLIFWYHYLSIDNIFCMSWLLM